MTAAAGFTSEELALVQRETGSEYHGLEMAVAPAEAKRRLQALQAFVQSVMVKGVDYGVIPGTDKPTLYQSGAQKLAELYGFSHRFLKEETVKDWDRGFFYFEYRCQLVSRRDGSFIGDGIGSCNSRESKYAGRWVFNNEVPPGTDKSKLKVRKGKSKKTGRDFELFLVPNDDPYSIVNTLQKMAAKRAYVGAVIACTRSSQLFTQDVEDLPPEAFGEVEHDQETGEVIDGSAIVEMHLKRIHECVSIDMLRSAGEAIKADADRISKNDVVYLRSMAKEKKEKLVALFEAEANAKAKREEQTEREPGSDDV